MAISVRHATYPIWFLQDRQPRRLLVNSVGPTAGATRCWCVTNAAEHGTVDASARRQWTRKLSGFARVACRDLHEEIQRLPTPAMELGGGKWTCLFLRTMRSTDTSSSPTTIDVA